jgi:hypothetical protein
LPPGNPRQTQAEHERRREYRHFMVGSSPRSLTHPTKTSCHRGSVKGNFTLKTCLRCRR